jgi:DNA topoisomerase IB
MGEEFTAKDFRTWGASLQALALLCATPVPDGGSERELKSCILEVVRKVAKDLRNTPAICRKSYINPQVFDAWRAGLLAGAALATSRAPRKAERWALGLLRKCNRVTSAVKGA